MKISDHLENDPKIGKTLLWSLIPVMLLAWLVAFLVAEWLEFIKSITHQEELIHITAGMGLLPSVFFLLLIFVLIAIGAVLIIAAQYTQYSSLLEHDTSTWFTKCFRVCIYSLIPCITLYFILPVFSDRIAERLGYEYYCPEELHISGPRYGYFEYTYAVSPDLCPAEDSETKK